MGQVAWQGAGHVRWLQPQKEAPFSMIYIAVVLDPERRGGVGLKSQGSRFDWFAEFWKVAIPILTDFAIYCLLLKYASFFEIFNASAWFYIQKVQLFPLFPTNL